MHQNLTVVTAECLSFPSSRWRQLSFSLRFHIRRVPTGYCVCLCEHAGKRHMFYATRSMFFISGCDRKTFLLNFSFLFPSCRLSLCSGLPAFPVLPARHSHTLVPHVLWTGSGSIQLWWEEDEEEQRVRRRLAEIVFPQCVTNSLQCNLIFRKKTLVITCLVPRS